MIIYQFLGNFKTNYQNCIVYETIRECSKKIKGKIDNFFFVLAMIHLEDECK